MSNQDCRGISININLLGINLASLLMLISMHILTQREIEKINFEYVYSEYEKYISGLGASDERYFRIKQ